MLRGQKASVTGKSLLLVGVAPTLCVQHCVLFGFGGNAHQTVDSSVNHEEKEDQEPQNNAKVRVTDNISGVCSGGQG